MTIAETTQPVQASTPAEQLVLDGCASGAMIDFTVLPADGRVVGGDFLRAVLVGGAVGPGRSLYVAGARIAGEFDVSFCDIPAAVRFWRCTFAARPDLVAARLAGVQFSHCVLPGILADRLHASYLFDISNSEVTGPVKLVGAEIGYTLQGEGARIHAAGGIAVNASLARIGASIHFGKHFECEGAIVLQGAHIGGAVDLDEATITHERTDAAVNLDAADVGGEIKCHVITTGGIRLQAAHVSRDLIVDGLVQGPADGAVTFHGAAIDGQVELRGVVEGTVGGYGSTVGDVVCAGAQLRSPQADALDLGRATIRANLDLRPSTSIEGAVTLIGANVGGGILMNAAQLKNESRYSLVLDHAEVEGNLSISGTTRIAGCISLVEATVRGGLLVASAQLAGAGLEAIVGDGSTIAGNVHLSDGASLDGGLRLKAATVASVDLESASLMAAGRPALDLTLAKLRLGLILHRSSIRGGILLAESEIGGIRDDLGGGPDRLGSWSGEGPLVLAGCAYRSLAGPAAYDRALREDWIRRTETHEPESWAQLEQAFRAAGRIEDARRIAISGYRDRIRRGGLSRAGRAWRWVLDATIGHGYAPWRAGLWGLAIIAAFALYVALDTNLLVATTATAGQGRHVQPLVYAADVFLPVIDFGEAGAWRATGSLLWVQWAVITAGWTLTTLFVTGFTKVIRN